MATKLNELKQKAIDAKAARDKANAGLLALLQEQQAAKAVFTGLLEKKATSAGLSKEDTEKLDADIAAAKAKAADFDGRIHASRTLENERARELETAQELLAAEQKADKLAKETATGSGIGAKILTDEDDKKPDFKSFGERLQAVFAAAQPGVPADERLLRPLAVAGQGENPASAGGFLVGTDAGSTILQKVYDLGNIYSRVNRTPISASSNGMKFPAVDETSRADGSRFGGVRGYWVEEAGSITASTAKFRQLSLTLRKVAALVRVTDELLADAAALEAWVNEKVPQELTFKIEDAIVGGDGSGKPLGWQSSPAVISVAKETGQVAATFTYPNALKMWARMYGPSRKNAVWLINQDVEPQLYQMALNVGTGGSAVFMPSGGASEAPFATLFGRPIIPAEYCATLGTVGDVQLVDPTQYRLIEKDGVQRAVSLSVYFATDEAAFRFIMRVDGAPEWNAALTPKNGTNTLSPYITLATRA